MIPLILIAIGLGAALTVYELSPKTRARVDAYVRAIRSANAAHQTADAHLATATRHAQQAGIALPQPQPQQPQPQQQPPEAPYTPWFPPYAPWAPQPWVPQPQAQQPAPTVQPVQPVQPVPVEPTPQPVPQVPTPVPAPADPQAAPLPAEPTQQASADAAVDHVAIATEANRDAAKNTADAAQSAQTDSEKQAAADSAAKVLERERQIAAALRTLGVGQCGVRTYPRITEGAKSKLLAKLRSEGMGVAGDNPWNIDTRQYGVKLRAVWDPRASVVKLIVTTGRGGLAGLVTCEEIWKKIDPIMREVAR